MSDAQMTARLRTVLEEICAENVSQADAAARARVEAKLLEAAANGPLSIEDARNIGRTALRSSPTTCGASLLDAKMANEMQAAVDEVFTRLPAIFKTEEVRNEIAKSVLRSVGDYREVARNTVLGMFSSIDRAIENRKKLANFK